MQIKAFQRAFRPVWCCAFRSRVLRQDRVISALLLATVFRYLSVESRLYNKTARWPRASVHFGLPRAGACRAFSGAHNFSWIVCATSECCWAPLQAAACCLPLPQGEGSFCLATAAKRVHLRRRGRCRSPNGRTPAKRRRLAAAPGRVPPRRRRQQVCPAAAAAPQVDLPAAPAQPSGTEAEAREERMLRAGTGDIYGIPRAEWMKLQVGRCPRVGWCFAPTWRTAACGKGVKHCLRSHCAGVFGPMKALSVGPPRPVQPAG